MALCMIILNIHLFIMEKIKVLIADDLEIIIEGVEALAAGATGGGPHWWVLPAAPLVAALTALIATRLAAHIVLRRG